VEVLMARAGMTTREKAFCADWLWASRTSRVKEKVPLRAGVPESSPEVENARPEGNAPAALLQE
jgi:hypothetical protein